MVSVAEPLVSLSSCPCTTSHPCVPGQPVSPWDQFAWYSTVPAGSGVDVGGEFLVAVPEACGAAVVDDAPAEQAVSEKRKNQTRNTRGMQVCFKRGGLVWESCMRSSLSTWLSKINGRRLRVIVSSS